MRRVLSDPALAADMRRKGLLRAREFSWERSVAKTWDVYQEVGGASREDSDGAAGASHDVARPAQAPWRTSASGGHAAMKVALVHDWLTGMRGGEKVLEVLCELLPRRRPLHALPPTRLGLAARSSDRRIETSFIQQLPFAATPLPLLPAAVPAGRSSSFASTATTW